MNYQKTYLIQLRFIGFRFHGWQKQPKLKTVHFILDKTLKFVLGDVRFKTIGVGRTDAKVSSSSYPAQLFVDSTIDIEEFIESFNQNSPSDIELLKVQEIIDISFNIIQHEKVKEYHYYFSTEGKNHPFCAPFMTGYSGLNLDAMKEAARIFEGTHYFGSYCTKPTKETQLVRTIDSCEIIENTSLKADFFPTKSYFLKVRGKGFLRYQVRLMMGALIEVGKGLIDLEDIKESLKESNGRKVLTTIAPGSGLQLFSVEFKNLDKYIQ